VLPSEILDYFSIVSVEESSSEIHIHLDELMNSELLLFRIAALRIPPLNFYCPQNITILRYENLTFQVEIRKTKVNSKLICAFEF
jgi:hypothetical protein